MRPGPGGDDGCSGYLLSVGSAQAPLAKQPLGREPGETGGAGECNVCVPGELPQGLFPVCVMTRVPSEERQACFFPQSLRSAVSSAFFQCQLQPQGHPSQKKEQTGV